MRAPIAAAFLAALMAVLLVGESSTTAFVVTPPLSAKTTTTTNLQMTVLVYKGKKKNFPPGSPLSRAAASLGIPVKYSCKKGDCATCQVMLAGRYVRCCTGKVPEEPKLKSLQEQGLEIK